MNHSLQFTNENLTDFDVKNVCNALHGDQIRSLSFRECELTDKDYKKIIKSVGHNKSILQLGLNVGVVTNTARAKLLAEALQKNRSLTALFISGNALGDEGMKIIGNALTQHPNIVSLDISDCNLGDDCIEAICDLLPCNGAKSGLLDLTLSMNPNISIKGWAKFGIALAASSTLRELYIDYNRLGDYGASCILIGLSSTRKIEVVDLESTGITDHTAQLILYLVENYPVRLRKLVLDENKIDEKNLEIIKDSIETIEESELMLEDSDDVSTTTSIKSSSVSDPVKVKVKSIKKPSLSSSENTRDKAEPVNNDNTNDNLKETTTTDEEYRILAEALEAGLKTTENETEPTTLQDNNEQDTFFSEENNLTKTASSTHSDIEDNVEEKSDLECSEKGDNSDDEGEELMEVPVIPPETVVNIDSTDEYRKYMEKKLEEEDIANYTIKNHSIKIVSDDEEEDWGEELKEVPVR